MRHWTLVASAVFGTLLLAGCHTSAAPGSAYDGATTNTPQSAASSGTTAPPAASSGTTAPPATSSGTASPSSASSAGTRSAVLTVRKTRLGYVLADANGFTIYWFARDHRGRARPACAGNCLMTWPPVTGTPVAATGVTLGGVLGTITRPDGLVQATYNGHPLYTFGGDNAPGQLGGNGAAGAWHVIKEKAPAPSTTA